MTRYSVLEKPGFKVMKLNFYRSLRRVRAARALAASDDTADYIKAFLNIDWEQPDSQRSRRGHPLRPQGRCYQCCLYRAGFAVAGTARTVKFKSSQEIRDPASPGSTASTRRMASRSTRPSLWFTAAWENYETPAARSRPTSSRTAARMGRRGPADADAVPDAQSQAGRERRARRLPQAHPCVDDFHTATLGKSFEDEIVELLRDGKIVIDRPLARRPEIQRTYSDRVCRRIFADAMERFIANEPTNFIQLYFEEAHNLFPRKEDKDLTTDLQPARQGRARSSA